MPNVTSYFQGIFGRSPFVPLQQHATCCYDCAALVPPFLAAAAAMDWPEAERIQRTAVQIENRADELKRDIRKHLPQSFFLPVARTDLLELLSCQDEMANRAKDIVGLMLGRRMAFPRSMQGCLMEFAEASVQACRQAHDVVHELDELLETGFSEARTNRVAQMVQTLEELEGRNDELQVRLRAGLFALEQALPAVDVIFMYKVIEWVGDLADIAKRVGHRLELLLAK
jgi:uncharacterized protein